MSCSHRNKKLLSTEFGGNHALVDKTVNHSLQVKVSHVNKYFTYAFNQIHRFASFPTKNNKIFFIKQRTKKEQYMIRLYPNFLSRQ
jgi:hypothetical protein